MFVKITISRSWPQDLNFKKEKSKSPWTPLISQEIKHINYKAIRMCFINWENLRPHPQDLRRSTKDTEDTTGEVHKTVAWLTSGVFFLVCFFSCGQDYGEWCLSYTRPKHEFMTILSRCSVSYGGVSAR